MSAKSAVQLNVMSMVALGSMLPVGFFGIARFQNRPSWSNTPGTSVILIVRDWERVKVGGLVASGGTVTAAIVTLAVPALLVSSTLRAVIVML